MAELAASQAEVPSRREEEKASREANEKDLEEGFEGRRAGLTVIQECYSAVNEAHTAA